MTRVTPDGRIVEEEYKDVGIGDHVVDSDKDHGPKMLVVGRPLGVTAEEYEYKDGVTVAESNSPDHPPEAPVVEVKFIGKYDSYLDMDTYAYPITRVEVVESFHD